MSDALQQMLDYKAIVELKARFVRFVDDRDWDGYRSLFADAGAYDFGGGFVVEGGAAFVDTVRSQLEGARSIHRAFLPEITIDSDTEAHGHWAVNDYIEFAADTATGERGGQQGFGYEYETYRKEGSKEGGVWKIASWRLRYIRVDPLPRAPLPTTILGGPDVLRDEVYLSGVTAPALVA